MASNKQELQELFRNWLLDPVSKIMLSEFLENLEYFSTNFLVHFLKFLALLWTLQVKALRKKNAEYIKYLVWGQKSSSNLKQTK